MNKYNPKGLRRNHRGQLLDKWGREMEVDWDEYEKKRLKSGERLKSPKVLNPMHAAVTTKKQESDAQAVVNKLLEGADKETRTYKITARPDHLDKLETLLFWINSTKGGHSGTAQLSIDGDGAARVSVEKEGGDLKSPEDGKTINSPGKVEFKVGLE